MDVLGHGSKEVKSDRERSFSVQALSVGKAITCMAVDARFPRQDSRYHD